MKRSDWFLLSVLYASQFLPVAFFFMGLPAILRDQGMAIEQIGALYVLGIIWVLKFIWAPTVDRWGIAGLGHYKGWLLLSQAGIALCRLGISQIDVLTNFGTMLFLAVIMTGLAATQDIAADATACRLLPSEARGPGNAIQIGGGVIGLILGGGGMVLVYDTFGWQTSVLLMALIMLVVMIPIAIYREEPLDEVAQKRSGFMQLVKIWRRPGMGRWALFMVLVNTGVGMGFPLLYTGLIDIGWSVSQAGSLMNIAAPVLSLLAIAAAGGLLVHRNTIFVVSLALPIQLLAILLLLPLARGDEIGPIGVGAILLVFCAHHWVATAIVTEIMGHTTMGSAGSDFSVQHSLYLLVGFVAGIAATQLAGAYGYLFTYQIACMAIVCAFAFSVYCLLFVSGRKVAEAH